MVFFKKAVPYLGKAFLYLYSFKSAIKLNVAEYGFCNNLSYQPK